MKALTISEAEWYAYELCRDLPVHLHFGAEVFSAVEASSITTLPKVPVHRLYRQWWAQTYFEQIVGKSVRTFVNQKLNKNITEVRRKTARRGKRPDASASAGEQETIGPERRQSLEGLFGPVWTEETDHAGGIVMEYSNQTFNRVRALFRSISFDERSSEVVSSNQLRTIDTRRIAALCAYGEPLCDQDDVMSLVAAVILFTRVPISRSTTFPLLKALGVASLGAGKRI